MEALPELQVVEWTEEREITSNDPWKRGIPKDGGVSLWEGEPFTVDVDGERGVDIQSVLRSHEVGQYPKVCAMRRDRWVTIKSERLSTTVSGERAVVLPKIVKMVRENKLP